MSVVYSSALEAFDAALLPLHMRGQWTVEQNRREAGTKGDNQPASSEPLPAGRPHLWRWSEIEPSIIESCAALPQNFTARRALSFKNPDLPRCTAQTLNMAIQVIQPGELAWAHRHSIAAIRFVIAGNQDLYTVVDGIACAMEDNDLVLTPGWSWHDHRNGADRMALWLDVLDVPLVRSLNLNFAEEYGDKTQPIERNSDDGAGTFDGLLRPLGSASQAPPHQPVFRYPWRDVEAALSLHVRSGAIDPHDGFALDYRNPYYGGPTLPTLGCRIQMLPPGFVGKRHRHTSSAVYHVVRGAGATELTDETLDWNARDSFVVPNWTWHRHVNRTNEPAILFSTSDAPLLDLMHLNRSESE